VVVAVVRTVVAQVQVAQVAVHRVAMVAQLKMLLTTQVAAEAVHQAVMQLEVLVVRVLLLLDTLIHLQQQQQLVHLM
jgi:hypothetical protein